MSSRGWAIALGIGAVVLAAILLVVYLDRYRARVGGENAPTPVLVAKQLIPTGTPGSIVATNVDVRARRRFRRRKSRSEPSPIRRTWPAAQRPPTSSPASRSRPPTSRPATPTSVDSQITGTQRAFSISIDNVHGSLSQVQAGDSVDVYTSVAGVVKLFAPNVKVLTIPAVPGPSGGSNLVLRIETGDASKWAYAADNTQLIFVLRPVVGAKPTKPSQRECSYGAEVERI